MQRDNKLLAPPEAEQPGAPIEPSEMTDEHPAQASKHLQEDINELLDIDVEEKDQIHDFD